MALHKPIIATEDFRVCSVSVGLVLQNGGISAPLPVLAFSFLFFFAFTGGTVYF
jgi:hypothetical protein